MTYEVIKKKNVTLPISIADAKKQVSIETEFTEDDILIGKYIKAAERFCSGLLGSDIAETDVTHTISNFLGGTIRVKESPLMSITSIKHYDADNNETVVDVADYTLLEDQFLFDISLPPELGGEFHKVVLQYKTGYINDDIPPDYISAIEIKVATLYDHERENYSDYKLKSNRAIQNLLAPYMRYL
tara:strand:+ start:8710 stop:9267 length:558 start_codon:yes stop_codon:yes gene_type:complete